jgi:hypothetical protein
MTSTNGHSDSDFIEYTPDGKITVEEYIAFFHARQPHALLDPQRVDEMLSRSILVTSRKGGQLVGFVRIVSDGYVFGAVAEIKSIPELCDDADWITKIMFLAAKASPTRLVMATHRVNPEILQSLGWDETFMGYAYVQKPRIASS